MDNKTPTPLIPGLIVTTPEQTGDIVHVAAALAVSPESDVLIIEVKNPNRTQGSIDQEEFFVRVVGNAEALKKPAMRRARIKVFSVDSQDQQRAVYNGLLRITNPRDVNSQPIFGAEQRFDFKFISELPIPSQRQQILKNMLQWGDLDHLQLYRVMSVYNASQAIGYYFRDEMNKAAAEKIPTDPFQVRQRETARTEAYKFIAQCLRYPDLSSNAIIKGDKFGTVTLPKAPVKPVLLLWSRYSGSNSPEGYNVKGDSDPMGQRQLLEIAQKDFTVITIGHDPNWAPGVHADCHLGEFYTAPPLQGKDRGAQISFFIALKERYGEKIFQLGQKSGGLDTGALVGIPTLFIDTLPEFKNRLLSWGYLRLYQNVDAEPPTIVGQALLKLYKIPKVSEDFQNQRVAERDRRLIALFNGLQSALSPPQNNNVNQIVTAVTGAKDLQKKAWETQFLSLHEQDYVHCGFHPGYAKTDQRDIAAALFGLGQSHQKYLDSIR